MKFNLGIEAEAGSARMRLSYLTARKKVVELKEVSQRRSLPQNAYLHLLLGAFGQHFGYTVEEAKQIYKELNTSIYAYTKQVRDKTRTFWRSSADLSKEEMAKSITVFKQKSAEAGYALPPATDQEWLRQIENEIERSKHYM